MPEKIIMKYDGAVKDVRGGYRYLMMYFLLSIK